VARLGCLHSRSHLSSCSRLIFSFASRSLGHMFTVHAYLPQERGTHATHLFALFKNNFFSLVIFSFSSLPLSFHAHSCNIFLSFFAMGLANKHHLSVLHTFYTFLSCLTHTLHIHTHTMHAFFLSHYHIYHFFFCLIMWTIPHIFMHFLMPGLFGFIVQHLYHASFLFAFFPYLSPFTHIPLGHTYHTHLHILPPLPHVCLTHYLPRLLTLCLIVHICSHTHLGHTLPSHTVHLTYLHAHTHCIFAASLLYLHSCLSFAPFVSAERFVHTSCILHVTCTHMPSFSGSYFSCSLLCFFSYGSGTTWPPRVATCTLRDTAHARHGHHLVVISGSCWVTVRTWCLLRFGAGPHHSFATDHVVLWFGLCDSRLPHCPLHRFTDSGPHVPSHTLPPRSPPRFIFTRFTHLTWISCAIRTFTCYTWTYAFTPLVCTCYRFLLRIAPRRHTTFIWSAFTFTHGHTLRFFWDLFWTHLHLDLLANFHAAGLIFSFGLVWFLRWVLSFYWTLCYTTTKHHCVLVLSSAGASFFPFHSFLCVVRVHYLRLRLAFHAIHSALRWVLHGADHHTICIFARGHLFFCRFAWTWTGSLDTGTLGSSTQTTPACISLHISSSHSPPVLLWDTPPYSSHFWTFLARTHATLPLDTSSLWCLFTWSSHGPHAPSHLLHQVSSHHSFPCGWVLAHFSVHCTYTFSLVLLPDHSDARDFPDMFGLPHCTCAAGAYYYCRTYRAFSHGPCLFARSPVGYLSAVPTAWFCALHVAVSLGSFVRVSPFTFYHIRTRFCRLCTPRTRAVPRDSPGLARFAIRFTASRTRSFRAHLLARIHARGWTFRNSALPDLLDIPLCTAWFGTVTHGCHLAFFRSGRFLRFASLHLVSLRRFHIRSLSAYFCCGPSFRSRLRCCITSRHRHRPLGHIFTTVPACWFPLTRPRPTTPVPSHLDSSHAHHLMVTFTTPHIVHTPVIRGHRTLDGATPFHGAHTGSALPRSPPVSGRTLLDARSPLYGTPSLPFAVGCAELFSGCGSPHFHTCTCTFACSVCATNVSFLPPGRFWLWFSFSHRHCPQFTNTLRTLFTRFAYLVLHSPLFAWTHVLSASAHRLVAMGLRIHLTRFTLPPHLWFWFTSPSLHGYAVLFTFIRLSRTPAAHRDPHLPSWTPRSHWFFGRGSFLCAISLLTGHGHVRCGTYYGQVSWLLFLTTLGLPIFLRASSPAFRGILSCLFSLSIHLTFAHILSGTGLDGCAYTCCTRSLFLRFFSSCVHTIHTNLTRLHSRSSLFATLYVHTDFIPFTRTLPSPASPAFARVPPAAPHTKFYAWVVISSAC